MNTDLTLEGLLINFCELVGKHLSENMAEAVWETLTHYEIQDRVNFIVCKFILNKAHQLHVRSLSSCLTMQQIMIQW